MEVTLTVGEALSGARIRAGLSVDQLSERTKIREKVVSGIERDDYEACGGNLFVRGYIRVMADAVGIDAQPLIQEYDHAHQGERMSVPPLRSPAADPESAGPESEGPDPADLPESGDAPESGNAAEPPHVFGAAASGVLAAGAAAAAAAAASAWDAPAEAPAASESQPGALDDDPEATSVDLPPVPAAPEPESPAALATPAAAEPVSAQVPVTEQAPVPDYSSVADTSFDLPAIVFDDAPACAEKAPVEAEQSSVEQPAAERSPAEPVTEIALADVFASATPEPATPEPATPEPATPASATPATSEPEPEPDREPDSAALEPAAPEPAAEAPPREEPFDVFARHVPAEASHAPAEAPHASGSDAPAVGPSAAEATRTDLPPVKPEPEPEPESDQGPEPVQDPESDQGPEPVPGPEPDQELEPVQETEPAAPSAAAPVAAPAGVAETSLDLKPVTADPEPEAVSSKHWAADPEPVAGDSKHWAAGLEPVSAVSAAAAALAAEDVRLRPGPALRSSLSGGESGDGKPRKRRKALLIGAAAVIVVAAAVVGGTKAFGSSGNSASANASGATARTASGGASGAAANGVVIASGSAKASPSAPGVKKLAVGSSPHSKKSQDSLTEVPVRTAEAFGPDGTSDGDNPGSASNLASASPDASWSTDWYATAQFGELKNGTGLLLDLGSEAAVTRVALNLSQSSGAGIELMTGNTPDLADLSAVASGENIGGDVVLNVTDHAKVRYLLVWFTTLPPASSTASTGTWASGTSASYMSDSSAGKFQATITDIAVAAQS